MAARRWQFSRWDLTVSTVSSFLERDTADLMTGRRGWFEGLESLGDRVKARLWERGEMEEENERRATSIFALRR